MTPSSSDLEGRTQRSAVSRTKKKLWNKMIVISCVIAISLDPLFLYIPFIDEEKKCLGMDKKLRNVALILRSATDITFLVDIGYTIYEGMKKADTDINAGDEIIPFAKNLARELEWCSLVTDLLSVFPMPQLLVVKVFSKMRGWGYLERRKVLNSFLLSQYFARIGRIILSSKQLTWTTGIRMKALFNLCLYILASHVFGAFWYFFSIQREITCRYWACKKHPYHEGCMSTFYCDDHITSTTVIAFLNEYCGTDVPDNTKPQFDYGIFLDSLEIGNTRHTHFPTKLCYSFWWGLRNLSNFGTNLTTSNYAWENFFAILTSITGLLLFVYLIGNVLIFIQMETTKSEKLKQKNFFDQMKQKIESIEAWMEKNGIPDDMKKEIMENINQKLKEDKDVADLENLFNVLPWNTKKSVKRFLCLNILSQVQFLKEMDDEVLKMMCDYLRPVRFQENNIIFQSGDQMDRMLLIIEGTLLTYSTSPDPSLTHGGETTKYSGSTAIKQVEKCEVYGEELLTWASGSPSESGQINLPTCLENVRCHTNVEGFALLAMDLTSVASKCKRQWRLRKYFLKNGGERLKEKLGDKARIFTESEIKEATNNYAKRKEIGSGRHGIVYRGVLDRIEVAIKKSKVSAPIDNQNQSTDTAQTDQNQNTAAQTDPKEITSQDQFVNEMTVLYQINHNNVVRFVGCCLETKPPILVYKFIRNGSLHTHIHGKEGENPPPPLPLATRLNIAAETAGALAYLHHDGLNKIIHGDVKTANILLDEDLTPKLSDFGASRLLVPEDENQISTLVHESVGYVDPEYLDSKKPLTEKSDVYSFGVVLAELLTGRKAEENLANDFVDSVEKDMLDQILDGKIVEEHLDKEVRKAADLAKRCLKPRGEERPLMSQVAPELQVLVAKMALHSIGGGEAKDTGISVG